MSIIEKLKECFQMREKLEGFEKSFIEDNYMRSTKFGEQTRMSEKQIKIIERIYKERIVEKRPYKMAEEKAEG